jgi:hypothetical protein
VTSLEVDNLEFQVLGIGDGTTTTFGTYKPINPNSIVFLNGLRQSAALGTYVIADGVVVFTAAPAPGDIVAVNFTSP